MSVFLHCDVDKMYFSVEAIENPALRDEARAVIVGRDPRTSPRGIVTTANAMARTLGISSGMSTAIAARIGLERGVEMVFVPPRHDLYGAYSRRLMDLLRTETPLLEQRSIDEAALSWDIHGFELSPVAALRERVLAELGLSVSFGVAATLLVAKMASEVAKTIDSHVCLVPPGTEEAFLAPLPVRSLIGVGPKSEVRLRALDVESIGGLVALELHELVTHFGQSYGRYLHAAARGIDASELVGERAYKSISAEHTFDYDTDDRAAIWRMLQAQARDVASRLSGEGLVASEVGIKVRYGVTWETITRQQRLPVPTCDHAVLSAAAAALMRKSWTRRAIRLIGLRAGRLQTPAIAAQLPLIN